jgi:hypothetical protein
MPLAVGNRWIYQTDTGARDTIEIVRAVAVYGEIWYESKDSTRYINRTSGLWVWPRRQTAAHVALHSPAVGDTVIQGYALVLLPGTTEDRTVPDIKTVVGLDTMITVPAGTFATDTYRSEPFFNSRCGSRIEHYGEGVGLVESYCLAMIAERRTLIEYRLK